MSLCPYCGKQFVIESGCYVTEPVYRVTAGTFTIYDLPCPRCTRTHDLGPQGITHQPLDLYTDG